MPHPAALEVNGTPRLIEPLRAMAEPLRFLDYILEDVQPAAVPVRSGFLVNVPTPARFALHKLVVLQRRPAAFATKAKKDVRQADMLLDVLLEDRPGEVLLALDAAKAMPGEFMNQLDAGAGHLSDRNGQALAQLRRE